MIRAVGLTKRFGSRHVLKNLEFSASPGEIIALTGVNGAGKTTLIRILSSLIKADSGKITVNGLSVSKESVEYRRKIGVVLHTPMLYGELTGEENLLFFTRLFAVQQPEQKIKEVLELMHLERRRSEPVRTYSRGMQQRLSIARAILHNPDILLMDEPYTGLDQDSARNVDDLILQQAHAGKVVLLTSHDLERSLAVSSRIDILHAGVISSSAQTKDLTVDEFTAFFDSVTHASNKARS